MLSRQDIPRRLRFIAGALVFLSLSSCSEPPPESAEYDAWYRPVPLGFCPRYIVGDRHAWVVGKIAPGTERKQIERRNLPGAEESPEAREGTSRSLFFAANPRRPITKANLVMNVQP